MARRLFRGAAAAALIATAAMLCGCGGGGADPALFAGRWYGSLDISYDTGEADGGALEMTLTQTGDFVSGLAVWAPVGTTQSITGPIDGTKITLLLHFRCDDDPRIAQLTGTFTDSTLTITGGSGEACRGETGLLTVSGAAGSLIRDTDSAPL